MRTVNPDDLDELAKLLDGRGGLQDKLDEAFTRASRLGVTAKVSALRPLRSWACDTAPDLRRRATVARLEEGHPEAGPLWAGFRSKELSRVQVAQMNPEDLALACAVATSSDPASSKFKRESNESLDDWLLRLRAHAISRVSGLDNYEPLVRPCSESRLRMAQPQQGRHPCDESGRRTYPCLRQQRGRAWSLEEAESSSWPVVAQIERAVHQRLGQPTHPSPPCEVAFRPRYMASFPDRCAFPEVFGLSGRHTHSRHGDRAGQDAGPRIRRHAYCGARQGRLRQHTGQFRHRKR